MKTWDIFDTLIARKSVFPQSIFIMIGQIVGSEDFANIRIAAERNLSRRGLNYNINDIYEELGRISDTPKNICDELKALEVQVELDNCIPITENLRQVKAGDVLISDMYLPENVIRKMLDKAGLFAPVEIIVTSGGKKNGRVWKEFADQNEFVFHIGDNMEGDVKKPRQYGFDSVLNIFSEPNQFESWLMQRDFPLAAYLREIRLRNPFSEEIKRSYWTLFTMNVGMLIILVQLIDKLQKNHGFEYLGFCGRDTYYMWLLYKKYKEELGEEPPPFTEYLYYSRKLAVKSKSNMQEYFIDKIKNRKALMIDLTGSGTHLHGLRNADVLNYSLLICFCDIADAKNAYKNKKSHPENWIMFDDNIESDNNAVDTSSANFYFLNTGRQSLGFFEYLNRATHNTPVRLNGIKIDDKIIPKVIFSEVNDTENFDVLETCMKEVLNSKITWSDDQNMLSTLAEMRNIYINAAQPVLHNSRQTLDSFLEHALKTFDEQ